MTTVWSPVDRMIGVGLALVGLTIALLNSYRFVQGAVHFATWWTILAALVALLLLIAVAGWSRFSPTALRALWVAQPAALGLVLLLTYGAWNGESPVVPLPQLWWLDTAALAFLALVVKIPYVVVALIALSATVPASALIFLGFVPEHVLGVALFHCSSLVFVVLIGSIRAHLLEYVQVREVAEHLRAEEEQIRAEATQYEDFARQVHDEVLATLGAATLFEGDPPAALRRSASEAVAGLAEMGREAPIVPLEIHTEDATQLIRNLISAAAPSIEVAWAVTSGQVTSAAASAVGLAAAEAARNVMRHAHNGAGSVLITDGLILVTILDAGPGFDPDEIAAGHFGVRDSIVRRMNDLPGGCVSIESGTEGTRVVIGWNRT